jgi:phage major head subunit gpT-like protein
MATNTAAYVAASRDLTARIFNAADTADPFYPRIATVVPSRRSYEKYGWIGSFPSVREWLGERKFNDLRAADYELVNKLWEASLLVEKTDIDDDVMGLYPPLADGLGARAARHPDKLVSDLVVAGESALGFDGQFFFDTDHVYGDSGSQSNDLTYAAASGTTPTAAEMKGAIDQGVAALIGFKDDQGEPMNISQLGRQDNLLVMIPRQLRVVTYEAMEATIISNTSNVVIDRPNIVVNPYLTDATKFYLFDLGQPLRPFVFQAREPLMVQTKGADDVEFKHLKIMTKARYNAGYLAWWTAVLTTFT